jgi:hypothetical protein
MLTPKQLEQLKQILAEVIEENSGEGTLDEQAIKAIEENSGKGTLDEQAIKALFYEKFEKNSIPNSAETWQQLDAILRHKSYQDFIKTNPVPHYTAAIAIVIDKEIEKHKPNGEVLATGVGQLQQQFSHSAPWF